jgi:RimJ/RimL family protein N-acetyltransferase
VNPVTLEGRYVRLEPISQSHREGLCAAIKDGELWKLHVTFVPHPDQVDGFLADAEAMLHQASGLVFATIDSASGRVIGSTRYMHASEANRRVEIGFTFLAKSFQRTRANTEAKLLMLTHAFESLGLNRVEFLTDYLNFRSRRAILRIGAKEEGLLRSHMSMPDGRVRDSMIYSIVAGEWGGAKRHLQAILAE